MAEDRWTDEVLGVALARGREAVNCKILKRVWNVCASEFASIASWPMVGPKAFRKIRLPLRSYANILKRQTLTLNPKPETLNPKPEPQSRLVESLPPRRQRAVAARSRGRLLPDPGLGPQGSLMTFMYSSIQGLHERTFSPALVTRAAFFVSSASADACSRGSAD